MRWVAFLLLLAAVIAFGGQGFDPGNRSTNLTLCGTNVAVEDPTINIIPTANSVFCNWKNAGLAVIGGIPNRTTQCGATLNPTGLNPPVANDDAVKLNAAISACTAGQFIQMGTGTFNYALSELPILLNKGITIRGSGSTTGTCDASTGTPCWNTVLQTYDGPQPKYNPTAQCGVTIGSTSACPNTSGFFLVSPSGVFTHSWAGCVYQISNPTASNCGTTIAADVAQGATQVQVASTANFSVGMWVLIDEYPALTSTTNPTGGAAVLASPEFLNTSETPATMRLANPDLTNNMSACTSGGNPGYSFCINRLNEEIHKITAIGGGSCPGVNCTLTFDDPLTLAFRQSASHDARVYWPTTGGSNVANPFLEQAGIENLTITRAAGGAINFEFCAYCWVKNVEVNYWIAGAVNFVWSVKGQVTGSYLHDCIDCQNNGAEYPIGISTASTQILVDNNIVLKGGKGMVGRAAAAAVIANNYFDQTFYMMFSGSIGDYWNDLAANCSHYGGTHHCLFEGNWSVNCDGDDTHGNMNYMTFFRNQCRGYRSTFVDPSNSLTVNDCAGIGYTGQSGTINVSTPPAKLRAAGPMAFGYWLAFAGNVMGDPAMQSCAGGSFTYGANVAGANGSRVMWASGWVGFEWPGPDANLTGATARYIFKNGNFDYVNSAIVDFATGFTHTFPKSFYTASTPAYFGPGAACTYTWPWIDSTGGTPINSNSCAGSGLPAKARADAGTPFVQP